MERKAEELLGPLTSEYRQRHGAWVHARARVADDAVLEPGAVIGADVELGSGAWIGAGAVIYGPTRIGEDNKVFPGAVLGGPPQDIGYRGEPTRLEIGDRNVFREGVSINRASTKEDGVTTIGSDNYFMANSHVGHDCVVEDHVVMANGVLVAGHNRVESNVNFAGGVALVQFCTVGRYVFVGGMGGTRKDLEPFLCHSFGKDGPEVGPTCVNEVGLKRAGFSGDVIRKLRTAFKVLFLRKAASPDLEAAAREIESRGAICAEVEELLDFMRRKRASKYGRQHQSG